jgi:hypothetical protein
MRLADLDRDFVGQYMRNSPLLFWVDKTLPEPHLLWMLEALKLAAERTDQEDAREFSAELPAISGVRATVEVVQYYDSGKMERGILVRRSGRRKTSGQRKVK